MSYVETGLGRGFFFFFNDTATTEIYTLSLHDALPICPTRTHCLLDAVEVPVVRGDGESADPAIAGFGLALHGEELNQGGIVACAGVGDAAPVGIDAA